MDLIDEILRDAHKKGEFSNLPGEGKPLKLDDDSYTPEHLRVAHKMLKDNDLAPEWIDQGKALDRKHDEWLDELRRTARQYRDALNAAARSAQPELDRQDVEKRWQAAQAALREKAAQHNREVLSYNLKVPRGVTHKTVLNPDNEFAKLSLR